MQTNPHKETPSAQVQRVALAIHGITDRFSAHEEAFGRRLKESALELIEETALYEIARTRDAAGTARLIHKLIERTEALRQLLTFVQNRGLVRTGVIEHLNFELTELINTFRAEDARFEEHVTRKHPHGAIIEAHAETVEPPAPAPQPTPAAVEAAEPQGADAPANPADPGHAPLTPAGDFDPLLGPDEVTASAATATAVQQKTELEIEKLEIGNSAEVETPANLPVAETKPDIREDQRVDQRKSAKPTQSAGLTDRQRKILGIFDREQEAPLKRVMEVLPMFSEKTLRNDLNALRKAGKIKRVGKAPRSKYVLIG